MLIKVNVLKILKKYKSKIKNLKSQSKRCLYSYQKKP